VLDVQCKNSIHEGVHLSAQREKHTACITAVALIQRRISNGTVHNAPQTTIEVCMRSSQWINWSTYVQLDQRIPGFVRPEKSTGSTLDTSFATYC
jgi:hypothetical protein